jgi:3-hydroxyisobutyrate dehydrogenase-like beta-hydroxyacid dehydrogenase
MGRVDAPVSGGAKGTKAGSLIVMAGGKDAYIARAQTITSAYAKRFAHIDPIGAGQASKVCTQMIIGSTIAVWDEALNFAKEFGVKATGPPDCLAID